MTSAKQQPSVGERYHVTDGWQDGDSRRPRHLIVTVVETYGDPPQYCRISVPGDKLDCAVITVTALGHLEETPHVLHSEW